MKTLIGTTTFRRHDPGLPTQAAAFETHGHAAHWIVSPDGEKAKRWCDSHAVDYGFEVVGSGNRLGVANNKNRIIAYFLEHNEYDHLFLFEDDCYPIADGWQELYLDAHDSANTGALLFLPEGMYGKAVWWHPAGRVHGLERDGGMLLSLTRRAVEKCGGFHPSFGVYGGEHVEYTRRLVRNKQMCYTRATPIGCDKFLDGWDVANYQGRLKHVRMAPFTDDFKQIKNAKLRGYAEQGLKIYQRIKDNAPCFQNPGSWMR